MMKRLMHRICAQTSETNTTLLRRTSKGHEIHSTKWSSGKTGEREPGAALQPPLRTAISPSSKCISKGSRVFGCQSNSEEEVTRRCCCEELHFSEAEMQQQHRIRYDRLEVHAVRTVGLPQKSKRWHCRAHGAASRKQGVGWGRLWLAQHFKCTWEWIVGHGCDGSYNSVGAEWFICSMVLKGRFWR